MTDCDSLGLAMHDGTPRKMAAGTMANSRYDPVSGRASRMRDTARTKTDAEHGQRGTSMGRISRSRRAG